ncbi:MAG: metal-sulfur cluster assembly factor [bacterium]|nr:metal-sulfur cluster assembly factor [bacterium]
MVDEKIQIDADVKELKDIIIRRGKPLKNGEKPLKNKDAIIAALQLVFDPEIRIDVYNLGLIYDVKLDKKTGNVNIVMTLTSPTCPMADEIPIWVAESVEGVDGVAEVEVKVVWYPAWDLSKLSEEAKFQMEIADIDDDFFSRSPFDY